MIDIHHHLLPGLDDGSTSVANSIEMARIAVEDGITHVVCTPHANHHYAYEPQVVEQRIADLEALLARDDIPLKLGRGADFHLTYDNIQTALADPARFSINGLGYLMVEVPDYGLPQGLTETFYQMQLVGLTPVLTHPERNPTLQQDPGRLEEWLRGGLLIQVTAGSVVGQMGRTSKRMAHDLLEKRWVHFLATDAHNTTTRPPRMQAAQDAVAKRYGVEYAHLLCVSNPLAAVQGKPLPPQLDPAGLHDELEPKNWWRRLVG